MLKLRVWRDGLTHGWFTLLLSILKELHSSRLLHQQYIDPLTLLLLASCIQSPLVVRCSEQKTLEVVGNIFEIFM